MEKSKMPARMMMDEMAEAFASEHPELFPTKQMIGRYARRKGYVLRKQTIDNKQIYFYIKTEQ